MDELDRKLPDLFSTAYELLWDRAFKDGGVDGANGHPLNGNAGIVGVADGVVKNAGWRVSTSEVTSVGAVTDTMVKAVDGTSRTLRDEKALRLKVKIDKRLRRMAREIMLILEGKDKSGPGGGSGGGGRGGLALNRICTGRCRKFGDVEWTYCARCGGPMRELEVDENE